MTRILFATALVTCAIAVYVGRPESRVTLRSAEQMFSEGLRDVDRASLRLTRISDAEELRAGSEIAATLTLPPGDAADQARVDAVAAKLVPHVRRKAIAYRFTVIDDESVNAFSLPGGHVYVMAGMMRYVQSNDELASVLGHEISHVDLRHCIERQQHANWLRRYGLRPIGSVADLVRSPLVTGYSKDQETEADVNGVRLTHAAGYDPRAAARLMRRMQRPAAKQPASNPVSEVAGAAIGGLVDYLRSHPEPEERSRIIERAAAALR